MIPEAYMCRTCGNQNIVKSGQNTSGSQHYWCKRRRKRSILKPKRGYTAEQTKLTFATSFERSSMRGIQRIFGVSHLTVTFQLNKEET